MNVMSLARKNHDRYDPRGDLRRAIAARDAAQAKAEQHREAIRRAQNMVREAEQKLTMAGEALERTRADHAEALAQAAATGEAPKPSGALLAARSALADSEDEAQAARSALDRLKADGDDLRASNPQLENAVLVAVAQVVAPVAARLLEEIRRKQSDLLTLQQVFDALTSDETIDVPSFSSDVQRLNAKDARMAPVTAVRDQFFHLDSKAGEDRAKEAIVAFRRWRSALRNDPAAPEPEIPM
jgi:DNA repair exonuclease SbcCD ATPase subunit